MLEEDLVLINKNSDIKNDHQLIEVKQRLESIIQEKKDREKMLLELDKIINSCADGEINEIYTYFSDNYYFLNIYICFF